MSTIEDSDKNNQANIYPQPPYPQQPNFQQQPYGQIPYPQSPYSQQPYGQPQPQMGQNFPNQQTNVQIPQNIIQPPPQNLPPIDQKRVDEDAAALYKAIEGKNKDIKTIIDIIAHRTNRERLAMIESYERQFNNKDLVEDLKKKLSEI